MATTHSTASEFSESGLAIVFVVASLWENEAQMTDPMLLAQRSR